MNYIITVIAAITGLTGTIDSSSQEQALPQEEAVEVSNIKAHTIICREIVQRITKDNPEVMTQFDVFTDQLVQVSSSGDGLSEKDAILIVNAVVFTADKHRIANLTPHIVHPIAVANQLITIDKVRDPHLLLVAILYDTIGDTPTSYDEIEKKFGKQTADLVREAKNDANKEIQPE